MPKKLEKKYLPLAEYFQQATQPVFTLTFSEIEQIVGQPLPNAAYLNTSWWTKTKPPSLHFLAWTDSNYAVEEVKLGKEVTFYRPTEKENSTDFADEQNVLIIRPVEINEANFLLRLMKTVESESDYMLFGKDERPTSSQGLRKALTNWRKTNTSTGLFAILNGEIAGYVLIMGNEIPRTKHAASLVFGVLEKYQNRHIATALLRKAEQWAKQHNISRFELTVMADNERAIGFYKKQSFKQEGVRKKSIYKDEQFVDELYMGKWLS